MTKWTDEIRARLEIAEVAWKVDDLDVKYLLARVERLEGLLRKVRRSYTAVSSIGRAIDDVLGDES